MVHLAFEALAAGLNTNANVKIPAASAAGNKERLGAQCPLGRLPGIEYFARKYDIRFTNDST